MRFLSNQGSVLHHMFAVRYTSQTRSHFNNSLYVFDHGQTLELIVEIVHLILLFVHSVLHNIPA